MMITRIVHISLLSVALIALSCQKDLPNQPKGNQLPSTRLWITSETNLRETVSRQHVYFYGEDADGYISGFLLATGKFNPMLTQLPTPDTLTYSWTTKSDSVIALPLLTKRDSFTVIVRAVDNHFSASTVPLGAIIKGFPKPYWDRDTNGTYSIGDVYLDALQQSIDPKGAIQLFPIVNTRPRVQFAGTPPDNPVTMEQPETTYTAATFAWFGTDDDGNQTIRSYRLALNDTTNAANWFELLSSAITKKPPEADTVKVTFYVKRADSDNAGSAPGSTVDAEVYTGVFGNLLLRGKIKNLKLNAENVLYIQAKDAAGEYSPPVRMPSTPTIKWFVKRPQGKMLVVGDYALTSSDRTYIINYYRALFSQTTNPILGGQLKNFDVFGFNRNKPTSYINFLNPAFVKTLQMYDLVLWFTDITPNITAAQIGLFYYINTLNVERGTYGHVIFTTQFQASPSYDDLRKYNDFAPLDSITTETQYGYNRLPVKDSTTQINTQVLPLVSGYPILYVDSVTTGGFVLSATGQHTVFYKRLYKRTDSRYIYRLDSARVAQPPYKGQLDIGIIDNQKRIVMIGLPLHLLNGWGHTLPLFFKKVIEDEFGLQ